MLAIHGLLAHILCYSSIFQPFHD